jgi:hypothetical protein
LLGDDDCGRFLPRCDFRLDLLGDEIGRDPVLDVRCIEFSLVGIDETGDDRSPNDARKPASTNQGSGAWRWHVFVEGQCRQERGLIPGGRRSISRPHAT